MINSIASLYVVFFNAILMSSFLIIGYKKNWKEGRIFINSKYFNIANILGILNIIIMMDSFDYLYGKYLKFYFSETMNDVFNWVIIPILCLLIHFLIYYITYLVYRYFRFYNVCNKEQ